MGSLLGGYLTQNYHPKYAFFIYSFMGLVVSVIGGFLSPESEIDPDAPEEDAEMSFCAKFG